MSGWLGYIASAAFLAGVAGGVHCAAMCGPIVAACAGSRGSLGWRRPLAYNAGRIVSYTLAGALAGAFGSAALTLRGGASAQTIMAALAGATMIVLAVSLAGYAPLTRTLESAGRAIWRRVQPYSRHVLPAETLPRIFSLGMLWGWLPCGMVYAVLVTAAATARPEEGALVMLAFGLGTLPNLIAIAFAAGRLKHAIHMRAVRLVAAGITAAFGVLGLSFAIHAHPYTVGEVICRWVS
jgi:sulfite exporter TauE/SafE